MISAAVDKEDFEDLADFSDRIGKAALRMQDLISTLGVYNSVDTTSVSFKNTFMQKVVDETISILGSTILEKNAEITIDTLPGVHGNFPQLVQLMQNLIGNAIKFCDTTAPKIHVSSKEKDDYIQFCVADNGIGIDKKFYKTIFSPFKRLHGSGNAQYSGSGLGLATCKKIVDRHEGEIWCDSEPGKGTKFYFTLPVATAKP
jgi:light-regulated signal transduction histidine kinase (bacteriophytochrome)